jgi:hypothetical protein
MPFEHSLRHFQRQNTVHSPHLVFQAFIHHFSSHAI